MKQTMESMFSTENLDVLLNINNEQDLSVVQDPTHLGGKMRNRTLKPSIYMPMGQKQVSVGHLKILIDTVSKDIHGLVRSDVLPEDKQNFRSFEKVTDTRVLNALNKYVADSEATVMYLKISRQMTSAFMVPDLNPQERISRIWHALYFLRAWRTWIKSFDQCENSQKLSLEKNFISDNAFTCAELNAYNLLHLICKFKDANTPELFLPTLFQSQACEETFRDWRSMTSINWTRINFSLLELIHLTGRIELRNDIVHFQFPNQEVCFPRVQNRPKKLQTYPLPSVDEIRNILREAQATAMADALKFGITVDVNDILCCSIRKSCIQQKRNKRQENVIDELIDENDLVFSNLKEYADKNSNLDDRFVQVYDENGSAKNVLKSSLVWTLTETKGVLSNDRLRRVRGQSGIPTIKRKYITKKDTEISPQVPTKRNKQTTDVQAKDSIQIGDWCFFKRYSSYNQEHVENIMFGSILSFKYIKGNNEKDKQYTFDFAPIKSESDRGVEVLATWYKYGQNCILEPSSKNNNFFINIQNYIATVGPPIINKNQDTNKAYFELKNHQLVKQKITELYEQNIEKISHTF